MKREIIGSIAIVTLLLGVAIPVYFGSVSQTLIDGFQTNTHKLEDDILLAENAGRSINSKILQSARDGKLFPKEFERIEDAFDSRILLQIIRDNELIPETGRVLPLMIQQNVRSQLKRILSTSINSSTTQILNTASYTGWNYFLPVNSNAGAPLEATLLAAALMVEEQSMKDALLIDIKKYNAAFQQGDPPAIQAFEQFYQSIFRLMNRYNWSITKSIVSKVHNMDDLDTYMKLLYVNLSNETLLVAAAYLVNDISILNRYMLNYPISALSDIELALSKGSNSLNTLLQAERPLHKEVSFIRGLQFILPNFILNYFRSLVLDSFVLGIVVKLGFFILSGLAISHFLLIQFRRKQFERQMFGLAISADVAFAIFFAFIVSIIIEPQLLQGDQRDVHTATTSSLSLIQLPENEEKPMLEATNIQLDKVSILILVLFFLAQVAIYYYSLLKIADIKKQEGNASLKLKLLDNEDNLFDAGLYVGLGGTVCSLILLVLGVLNASLIAAYASTLFGIIFVAILKIFNVRPFRNELTIEQHKELGNE